MATAALFRAAVVVSISGARTFVSSRRSAAAAKVSLAARSAQELPAHRWAAATTVALFSQTSAWGASPVPGMVSPGVGPRGAKALELRARELPEAPDAAGEQAMTAAATLCTGVSALRVKRLSPEAVIPARGSVHAAGFDLAASEATTVPAGGKAIVKTGLSIAIPEGTYARIAPRSGLAAKRMINVGAGVVDYDYRGEVGVVLFNHGPEAFEVAVGDRIAQLILEMVSMVECKEVATLEETARGAGGFGSTGVSDSVAAGAADAQAAAPAEVSAPVVADEENALRVQKLRPDAILPVRGSRDAAGFDLSAVEAATVKAGGKAIIKTGLRIAIPWGTYARVAPRSGLAAKKMIHAGAGVVDYDYRGEVGVVLFNHGTEDFEVAPGDRVAQLILEQISMAPCVAVENLDETERGAGGFGSTGVAEKVEESPAKRPRVEGAAEGTAADGGEVAKLREEIAALRRQVEAFMAAKGA